ncbi:hypothetical protein AA103196_2901 [Ameyamaea chiangmaiensis NBRC 103196]|uniref:Uncharacterized protein n=1 Tax=Ameyamaea chiangmaiensis TaxID=442969 RepID=A0A850PIH9_9PROT|nr:hypothetical protein [Ameyamaea chiangmaiensis]MBS4074388.1 hypothetical protein [Ameyamaea chiangmaiensis]NVN41612.1 hypothetical protein [Ameyamaea chiangmaiensis]GBQ71867.1 hypothetical protein AA103196_2901 [Ameyamaea chiangmaiensis NBRC 103196]
MSVLRRSGAPRPRRTLRQHIVRRLLLVLPAGLLAVVLMRMGWLDQAADKLTFSQTSWFDNTALVEHLRVVLPHKGVTDGTPGRCLLFIVDGNSPMNATLIEVLQKHTGSCSGDPKDLPKLMTVRVDRPDGVIETDKGTPGTFHLLP